MQQVAEQVNAGFNLLGWSFGFYFGPAILVLIALVPTTCKVAVALLDDRMYLVQLPLRWLATLSRLVFLVTMLVVGNALTRHELFSITAWQQTVTNGGGYLQTHWLSAFWALLVAVIVIEAFNLLLEHVLSEYRVALLIKRMQRHTTPANVRMAILAVVRNMVVVPILLACMLHAALLI